MSTTSQSRNLAVRLARRTHLLSPNDRFLRHISVASMGCPRQHRQLSIAEHVSLAANLLTHHMIHSQMSIKL